jgi:MFS family permease
MYKRNVYLISLTSFFTDMATSMVTSVLPVFVVYHLGAGYEKLGIIVGLGIFVAYFFRFLFGYLSDYFGASKIFLILGYGLSAVANPLLYFANSWKTVAIFRILDRTGKAIRIAPRDRLLSLSGAKEQGKTFGFHQTFDLAGKALGASIAFLILFYLSNRLEAYRYIFLASALPGFLALLTLLGVKDIGKVPKKVSLFNLPSQDLKLIPLLLVIASAYLFMWPLSFFLAESKAAGYSEAVIPLLFILPNAVESLLGYPTGSLIDKIGLRILFPISLILGAVSVILILHHFAILSLIFFALHQILYINGVKTFIGKHSENKGTIFGLFYLIYGLLGAVGSFVIGHLLNGNLGYWGILLYSCTGLVILSILFPVLESLVLKENF